MFGIAILAGPSTMELPWAALIQQGEGSFDAALEPELKRLRAEYFFNE